MVCLYGCGAHKPAAVTQQQVLSQLSQPITANLVVTIPDLTVEGRLERTGPEVYSFRVSAPQPLEGLAVKTEQQNVTLSFRGMEADLSCEPMPSCFAIAAFNAALDELSRQQAEFRNTGEGGAVLTGSLDGASFQLEVDNKGQPVLFTLPQYELSIGCKQPEPSQ